MDPALFGAVALLVVWAIGTFFLDAPGWINLLLSVGMFLLIWRIVVRATGGSTTKQSRK